MAWKKKDDDDDDDESTQEAKGENENVSRNSQGTCSETSLKDVTAPRTTSVCISFDRNVFVTQLELTFSPLSLQDPPFYRCTRGHTTHIHTINTENTFSFFFPETRHSLFPYFFSLPLSTLLFLFSFPSFENSFQSHAKPSNVQLLHDWSMNRAGPCSSL